MGKITSCQTVIFARIIVVISDPNDVIFRFSIKILVTARGPSRGLVIYTKESRVPVTIFSILNLRMPIFRVDVREKKSWR